MGWTGFPRGLAPDPIKIRDHAEADGDKCREGRRDEILHADGFQDVRRAPPNRKAEGIYHVIPPKSSPRQMVMGKYPAVDGEKPQQGAKLAREQSRQRKGPREHSHHHFNQTNAEGRKHSANDNPSSHLWGDDFLQWLHSSAGASGLRRWFKGQATFDWYFVATAAQKSSGRQKDGRLVPNPGNAEPRLGSGDNARRRCSALNFVKSADSSSKKHRTTMRITAHRSAEVHQLSISANSVFSASNKNRCTLMRSREHLVALPRTFARTFICRHPSAIEGSRPSSNKPMTG